MLCFATKPPTLVTDTGRVFSVVEYPCWLEKAAPPPQNLR